MRADFEYLELRIQELEEENLQLKAELDERPTVEDKQMDEEYIDELRSQVRELRIQRTKLNLAVSEALRELADVQDVYAAQGGMIQELCEEIECLKGQQVEVV